MSIPSTTSSSAAASSALVPTASTQAANVAGASTIAGNFDTFLKLLTTQLQNQNPLDPLDTNQFTQQLVAFASVEQQVNMNGNLQTLISMQQSTETTAALQLLGDTVTVKSSSAALSNATGSPASWGLNSPSPANATVTVTTASGQIAFSGTTTLSAGSQTYTWNGQGNNGATWPDGNYTISINATGANGRAVAVTPQVQGVVSAINVNQFPPLVTINGQTYPMSQIQSIATAASKSSSAASSASNAVSNTASAVNNAINSLLSKL